MGSSCAAASTLPKVNSETNLAVQLLLAVSGNRKQSLPESSRSLSVSVAKPFCTRNTDDDKSSDRSCISNEPVSDPSSSGAITPTSKQAVSIPFTVLPRAVISSAVTATTTSTTADIAPAPTVSVDGIAGSQSQPTQGVITSMSQTPSPLTSPCLTPNHSHNTPAFKYSREERQQALNRFREKKRRRQFRKRVRYHVRKRLAEARPRYKGRFSKPPSGESSDDASAMPETSTQQTSQSSSQHQQQQQKEMPSSSLMRPSTENSLKAVAVTD